ncbi:MAG: nucleotidyltransferase family protein [Candidatus Obscuribacterales bacterium]|nr:nucleotidyltransferase family protein [Candidatus Obscuribacterales bacterium]
MRPEIEIYLLAMKPREVQNDQRMVELLGQDLDWQFFNLAAIAHKICPILSGELKRFPEYLDKTSMVREESSEIQRKAMMLTARLFRLQDALKAAGIQFVFVKGTAVAHLLYGTAVKQRSFCDIDFFISPKDAVRVREILANQGFLPNQMWCRCDHPDEFFTSDLFLRLAHEKEFVSSNGSFAVDLHWGAGAWFATGDQLMKRTIELNVNGHRLRTLEPNLHLVYLCAHAAKHDWSTLIWISDIAHALASKNIFDWRKVARISRALGLFKTVQLSMLLANQLLGAAIPQPFLPMSANLSSIASEIINRYDRVLPPLICWSQLPFWKRIWHVYDDKGQVMEQILSDLFKPTFNDWVRIKLPEPLYWMYGLIRPLSKVYFTGVNFLTGASQQKREHQ